MPNILAFEMILSQTTKHRAGIQCSNDILLFVMQLTFTVSPITDGILE